MKYSGGNTHGGTLILRAIKTKRRPGFLLTWAEVLLLWAVTGNCKSISGAVTALNRMLHEPKQAGLMLFVWKTRPQLSPWNNHQVIMLYPMSLSLWKSWAKMINKSGQQDQHGNILLLLANLLQTNGKITKEKSNTFPSSVLTGLHVVEDLSVWVSHMTTAVNVTNVPWLSKFQSV